MYLDRKLVSGKAFERHTPLLLLVYRTLLQTLWKLIQMKSPVRYAPPPSHPLSAEYSLEVIKYNKLNIAFIFKGRCRAGSADCGAPGAQQVEEWCDAVQVEFRYRYGRVQCSTTCDRSGLPPAHTATLRSCRPRPPGTIDSHHWTKYHSYHDHTLNLHASSK